MLNFLTGASGLLGGGGGGNITQETSQNNQQSFSANVNPIITVSSPRASTDPNNIIETRPIADMRRSASTEDNRGGALPGQYLTSNTGIDTSQSLAGDFTTTGFGGTVMNYLPYIAIAGVALMLMYGRD